MTTTFIDNHHIQTSNIPRTIKHNQSHYHYKHHTTTTNIIQSLQTSYNHNKHHTRTYKKKNKNVASLPIFDDQYCDFMGTKNLLIFYNLYVSRHQEHSPPPKKNMCIFDYFFGGGVNNQTKPILLPSSHPYQYTYEI